MSTLIIRYFIEPGLDLLPPQMDTPEARQMLVTIALQESRFEHRLQIGGPARGFWQFEERGGIMGVLNHRATNAHINHVCLKLRIPVTIKFCYEAVAFNDTLACIFARLLLWTLPRPLPAINEVDEAWEQYIDAWRPGKPHRHTWTDLYRQAQNILRD